MPTIFENLLGFLQSFVLTFSEHNILIVYRKILLRMQSSDIYRNAMIFYFYGMLKAI